MDNIQLNKRVIAVVRNGISGLAASKIEYHYLAGELGVAPYWSRSLERARFYGYDEQDSERIARDLEAVRFGTVRTFGSGPEKVEVPNALLCAALGIDMKNTKGQGTLVVLQLKLAMQEAWPIEGEIKHG